MTKEHHTRFNKFTGPDKNDLGPVKLTKKQLKALKEEQEKLARQYAPVRIMTAEEYRKERARNDSD